MFIERLIGFHVTYWFPLCWKYLIFGQNPIIWILAIISVASVVREVLNLPAV